MLEKQNKEKGASSLGDAQILAYSNSNSEENNQMNGSENDMEVIKKDDENKVKNEKIIEDQDENKEEKGKEIACKEAELSNVDDTDIDQLDKIEKKNNSNNVDDKTEKGDDGSDDDDSDDSEEEDEDDDEDVEDDDEEEEGELSSQDSIIMPSKKNMFTENSFTSYYNKVFLMRSDIPYIDLCGTETQGKLIYLF